MSKVQMSYSPKKKLKMNTALIALVIFLSLDFTTFVGFFSLIYENLTLVFPTIDTRFVCSLDSKRDTIFLYNERRREIFLYKSNWV